MGRNLNDIAEAGDMPLIETDARRGDTFTLGGDLYRAEAGSDNPCRDCTFFADYELCDAAPGCVENTVHFVKVTPEQPKKLDDTTADEHTKANDKLAAWEAEGWTAWFGVQDHGVHPGNATPNVIFEAEFADGVRVWSAARGLPWDGEMAEAPVAYRELPAGESSKYPHAEDVATWADAVFNASFATPKQWADFYLAGLKADGAVEIRAIDKHEDVRAHNHYFVDVSDYDYIDVYRVLELFKQTDPVLAHIAKKALCAGRRGHKDLAKDVQDIADSAKRKLEMLKEDGVL